METLAPVTSSSLCAGFLRSSERFAARPALELEGIQTTYGELRELAAGIAVAVAPSDLVAVFAHRTLSAYAGVLGALLAGRGYVPLNRTFPPQRTRAMLHRSGCRALVVDAASAAQLEDVLEGAGDDLLLVLLDHDDVGALRARFPQHTVLGRGDLDPSRLPQAEVRPDGIAYLLFTSGSTGVPKGVGVTHANARHFVASAVERYGIHEEDRLTQTFDLTFDLSVFDMFVAWERGACVCVLPEHGFLRPDRWLDRAQPTVWFSVPSLGLLMQRLGMLAPGRYTSVRWSLFCGEALPVALAADWMRAASGSTLENLYGPTELTIACTVYRWDPATTADDAEYGVVPIGDPLPGMQAVIADEALREVRPGTPGELLMTGPQLTPGYWRDDERTAASFVQLESRAGTWYRTGDLVRRREPKSPLVYLGRVDHQVKVNGYRVELGEVEAALRDVSSHPEAVAIAWPRTDAGSSGLAAFVVGEVDAAETLARLAERLPSYMVPAAIHALRELPLNANGKVDRAALAALLDDE